MECKEKILEAIELADKISSDYGIYTSIEFTGFGYCGEGVSNCVTTFIYQNEKVLTTAGEIYDNFEINLDFVTSLLKDTIKVMEALYA